MLVRLNRKSPSVAMQREITPRRLRRKTAESRTLRVRDMSGDIVLHTDTLSHPTLELLLDHLASVTEQSPFQMRLLHHERILDDPKYRFPSSLDLQLVLLNYEAPGHEESSALKEALTNGDEEELRRLLRRPVDPNAPLNPFPSTLTFLLSLRQERRSSGATSAQLRMLLNAKANPNEHANENVLYLAVKNNSVECVDLLLRHRSDPNKHDKTTSPLLKACEEKSIEIVEHLLKARADFRPVARCDISSGACMDSNTIALYMRRLLRRQVSLLRAATQREALTPILTELVPTMIYNTQRVLATGLCNAARHGNMAATQLLLEMKADANSCVDRRVFVGEHQLVTSTDCLRSAVTFAAENGHVQVAEQLLRRGADVNMKVDGKTPVLQAALRRAESSILTSVSAAAADLQCSDALGRTALEMTHLPAPKATLQSNDAKDDCTGRTNKKNTLKDACQPRKETCRLHNPRQRANQTIRENICKEQRSSWASRSRWKHQGRLCIRGPCFESQTSSKRPWTVHVPPVNAQMAKSWEPELDSEKEGAGRVELTANGAKAKRSYRFARCDIPSHRLRRGSLSAAHLRKAAPCTAGPRTSATHGKVSHPQSWFLAQSGRESASEVKTMHGKTCLCQRDGVVWRIAARSSVALASVPRGS